MFNAWKVLALILLISLTAGCTSFWSSDADDSAKPIETPSSEKDIRQASSEISVKSAGQELTAAPATEPSKGVPDVQAAQIAEQISLAQARTVERMAEIEAELRRQRETIKLLEQGLLTGIAPDDLRRSLDKKTEKRAQQASNAGSDVDENIDLALGVVTSSPLGEPVLDADLLRKANHEGENPEVTLASAGQFESLFAKAKAKYQASDFSGALADFADLARKQGENTHDGVLRFWLGKCYAGLKDYGTARQELEVYLSRAPKSSQVAEARLELSKVLLRLGLKERAQNELKKVISDFDGQEPAEVAAHELGNLQGSL
jgi:TolA-binding protein